MSRLHNAFTRLVADLRKLKLPWALVGGMAVTVRARPRTTEDLDVVITVHSDREAEKIAFSFLNLGYQYRPGEHALEQEDGGRLMTVRLLAPEGEAQGIVVDLLFASSGIEPEIVAAAEPEEILPGVVVPVARTGHLIAQKVLAGRELDVRDCRWLWEVADEAEKQLAQVRPSIPALDGTARQYLESALWDWIHPSYAARGAAVAEEDERVMRAFALQALQDLIPLAQTSPGLRSRLVRLAEQLDATLPIELDPVFELLYPDSYVETEPAREAARQDRLRKLAEEWALLGPEAMAQRLARYEAEAERIGYSWPRGSQAVCHYLADYVDNPLPWFKALQQAQTRSAFVSPFLDRMVQDRHASWEAIANQCLEGGEYQFAAIDAILRLLGAPPRLLEKALDHAATWPTAVETLALRREIPVENLRAALRHHSWKVALAAAVGEWHAGQEKAVRDELRADWREAIRRARTDDSHTGVQHWLGVILAQDPGLALDWLRARMHDLDPPSYFLGGPFVLAVQVLRREQRAELLNELPALPILESLLPLLVERDAGLYRQLLKRTDLKDFHLAPLGGKPDEAWSDLALLALGTGHSPEQIAAAAIWRKQPAAPHAWPGVERWSSWKQAFAQLVVHSRTELREIGRSGQELIEPLLQRAQYEQEQMSLHGF